MPNAAMPSSATPHGGLDPASAPELEAQVVAAWIDGAVTRVTFSTGEVVGFHHIWLRDNCGCAACRHAVAGERLADPASIPLDIQPSSVRASGDSLELDWVDGHATRFRADWLDQHAYDRAGAQRRPLQLWDAAAWDRGAPSADYPSIMGSDDALKDWLVQLRRDGFTIVTDMEPDAGCVVRLAERVAFLRNSNFGPSWDVRSEPKPNSLAYTAVKLTAHTDLVSRESQPGVQFLHCLVNEAQGGESILVDGFAVAEALRAESPEHWEVLTRVPATFRYQSDDTDVSASFPIIRLDHKGEYFEVRYSNALLAPLDCDPSDVPAFYAAYQAFSRLLREPRFEYSFKLTAGVCEVFDNRRVMHGRQAFDANSGRRLLNGAYVDTDDFLSRIRVLQRTADFRLR